LADLEQSFTVGAEIWPWQSERIDCPTFEDGLYNDYRVVHFHLGVGFKPSGYINRTGELLFAIVDPASVYEIGIYRHGDWYELDILDIIDANWPTLLDAVTSHSLDVSNYPRTRNEVKALREAGIVSIIELKNGRIIFPLGGGTMMDRTSIEAVDAADYWTRLIRDGEKKIISDILAQIEMGTMEAKDYEILLHVTDDEVSGVIDTTYKCTLWKSA
jgi:hypothetical protein